MRSSLKSFLSSLSVTAALPNIVLGNEAADLDSLVSSLAYAFFRTLTAEPDHEPYIPCFCCPRDDLPLRPEAIWFLRDHLGLGENFFSDFPSELEFRSEFEKRAQEGNLSVCLVDHNLPFVPYADSETVCAILDHHVDEGECEQANPRIVEPVGSCCTLVAREILNQSPQIMQDDPILAEMLLGAILLDTINLDPRAKRVTPVDVQIARMLSSILGMDRDAQTRLCDELTRRKFDHSDLTDAQALRADYKEFEAQQTGWKIGIPSCRKLVVDSHELEEFRQLREVDVLFVMIQNLREGILSRELVVHIPEHFEDIKPGVVESLNERDYGLIPMEPEFDHYQQENIAFSRKALAPDLTSFFAKTPKVLDV